MSDENGRQTGFIPKLIATVAWGVLVMTVLYFILPQKLPLGFGKPPLSSFLMIGACWPAVWLLCWGGKVLLPMPLELGPTFVQLVLVGPAHFVAWMMFGKKGEEEKKKKD